MGRGKGSLVDVRALAQWRQASTLNQDELMQQIAAALLNALDPDHVHDRIRISPKRAAQFLALTFERMWWAIMQTPLDVEQLPPEMRRLCSIYLD